jgi:hypothetical protein
LRPIALSARAVAAYIYLIRSCRHLEPLSSVTIQSQFPRYRAGGADPNP